MKHISISVAAALGLMAASSANAQGVKTVKITLTNTLPTARANAPVTVSVADLKSAAPDFDPANFIITTADANSISADAKATSARALPCQADDTDGNGTLDEIAFEDSLPPGATRVVTVEYGSAADIAPRRINFPKLAHASSQQKYEGMGWESDRVGWRMYFDERNAFEMWGKKQHAMLLDYFALPGVDYHSESPLGRDTYKIGDALGMGSVGGYVDGKTYKVSKVDSRTWKIVSDGPVRAIADLIYKGWDVGGKKVDITSRLTVWAGHQWFDHQITATGADGVTLVTGLPVKPANEVTFSSNVQAIGKSKTYAISTWGRQVLEPGATSTESLPDHNMGLAVIVVEDHGNVKAGLADPANHLIGVPLVKGDGDTVTSRWRVVSAWDEESPDGDSVAGLNPALQMPLAVESLDAWKKYVSVLATEDGTPVEAHIEK
jgi:hypothetical protein